MSGSLIPNGKQQYLDANGAPLAGGKVYYYIPYTTTAKNTWQDINLTILNTNPIILDSAGECIAWGSGAYRQQVYDVNDNLIWDQYTYGISPAGSNFISQEEVQTATQGQVVFTLATITYVPGINSLVVFVNGSKQLNGTNYTETAGNAVTFVTGLNAGDVVDFYASLPATAQNMSNALNVAYVPPFSASATTNVQAKLSQTVSPTDFGAVGDGTTNDTTAITNMVTALAAQGGGTVYLNNKTYYMNAGVVDFSALNNVTFIGPGGFKGPAVEVQGQATLGIKLYGTLGTAVSYGSTIARGTGDTASPFTLSNSFSANQYLLLSNFPTDATDAYTNGTPDIFGNIPRNYANTSSSNLRQTRRKEILQVRSSTGSAFTCYWATSYYYSNATTQFQVMTMPSNILFDNVTFTNVYMYNRYTNNVSFTSCKAFASNFSFETCVNNNVDFSNCDFQNTDSRVDFFGASRFFRITGVYKNNNTPSDNGMVKATGCTDYMVDLQAAGGLGTASYGFQADTNFSNDYQGYTDLCNLNYQIRVTAKDMNGGTGISIFTDPYAVATSGEITNGYGKVEVTSQDSGILLKGCANVNVYGNIYFQDGSTNSVYLYGTTSCGIFTTNQGNIYNTGTVTNPRGGQTQSNTDCRGFWFSWPSAPILQGATTAGTYTYNTNATTGEYYRIGNSVKLRGYITVSGITSAGTGNLQIGNVPYTANSGTSQYGITNVPLFSYLTLTAGYTQVGGYVVPGQSPITLNQNGSANPSAPLAINTAVAANTQLMFNAEIQV